MIAHKTPLLVAAVRVLAVLAGGLVAAVAKGPATTAARLPSQVLDLANWKLTLPLDTSQAGKPDEIRQPQLATFRAADCFDVTAGNDGVVFRAACGGVTTHGSSYPRSELRQMDGPNHAGWSTTAGTHTMTVKQAITHLPAAKPHVVAGQIHDAKDDVLAVRLEGDKLFFDQNGKDGPVLTDAYQPGEVFTVQFVAQSGGIDCYYNGRFVYTYAVEAHGCYFKAGCYTQSNVKKGDDARAYGEVVIYELSVTSRP